MDGSEIKPLISGKALGYGCDYTNTCTANIIKQNEEECNKGHRQKGWRRAFSRHHHHPFPVLVGLDLGEREMCCLSIGGKGVHSLGLNFIFLSYKAV